MLIASMLMKIMNRVSVFSIFNIKLYILRYMITLNRSKQRLHIQARFIERGKRCIAKSYSTRARTRASISS